MYSKEITIGYFANVRPLVQVVERYIEDIDLVRGRYVVDCKSIMGVFSLDLSKPAELRIHTEDAERAERFFKEVEEALRG